MDAERYMKQAVIAKLCDHPDKDAYIKRVFSDDNVMNMLGMTAKLTKADLFMPDDAGKFIIDTPGFWNNIAKIADLLQKESGEYFTIEDFIRPLTGVDGDANLLASAARCNLMAKLFSPEVWMGRFEEMETLWYHVGIMHRRNVFNAEGTIDLDVKRRMLAAEGREMPEDRLAKAGLIANDIVRMCIAPDGYHTVKAKLVAAGDYLRKEYLLLTDRDGDNVFYQKNVWANYLDIVGDLHRHNQRFEVEDLLRVYGTRHSILGRAAESQSLHLILTPAHWADRLDDMMELWGHFAPGWKIGSASPAAFDMLYAEAQDMAYAPLLNVQKIEKRAELLTPIADDTVSGKAVLPLALKSVWENIVSITAAIAKQGERLTLDDLRQKSGAQQYSCLMSAAKMGYFDDVVKIMKSARATFNAQDFLEKDQHGVTLLQTLADQRRLWQVFEPDQWVGRLAEMKALWAHVKVTDYSQVDIRKIEVEVKQLTLSKNARPPLNFG